MSMSVVRELFFTKDINMCTLNKYDINIIYINFVVRLQFIKSKMVSIDTSNLQFGHNVQLNHSENLQFSIYFLQ